MKGGSVAGEWSRRFPGEQAHAAGSRAQRRTAQTRTNKYGEVTYAFGKHHQPTYPRGLKARNRAANKTARRSRRVNRKASA